jgi:hypothetical protein
MNSVIVIICVYLLGNILEGFYIQEYYFNKLEQVKSSWSAAEILVPVFLVLVIVVAIIKEKHKGLKMIQIGIVIFFLTFSYSSAINRVHYFETHNTRFYRFE